METKTFITSELIKNNRKLRDTFDKAPDSKKLHAILQWLCWESDCMLALYYCSNGKELQKTDTFSISFIQNRNGDWLPGQILECGNNCKCEHEC